MPAARTAIAGLTGLTRRQWLATGLAGVSSASGLAWGQANSGQGGVAVVIGNAAYAAPAGAALRAPAQDAAALAESLQAMGFQVLLAQNASLARMQALLQEAGQRLQGRRGLGLFCYFGHAAQWEQRNFLLPVDAAPADPAQLRAQALDVQRVLDTFRQAGTATQVLVLDACHAHPFPAGAMGLAPMDAPPGSFIAYATAPGHVVDDSAARAERGRYGLALTAALRQPATGIEDLFKRVRFEVRRASQGRQVPWEATSLEQELLLGQPGAPRESARERERAEAEAWARLGSPPSAEQLYAFVAAFPNGRYTEIAHALLNLQAPVRLPQAAAPTAAARLNLEQPYFGPRFLPGDRYRLVVRDAYSGRITAEEDGRITGIDGLNLRREGSAPIVERDATGARRADGWSTYTTPIADLPADYQRGRRWTVDTGWSSGGFGGRLTLGHRIVGRDRLEIGGRHFDCWVIECEGQSRSGMWFRTVRGKTWALPGFGMPLKQVVRIDDALGGSPIPGRYDTTELVALDLAG